MRHAKNLGAAKLDNMEQLPLQLKFLGEPKVAYRGQTLKFATRKTLALLIYLVLEGGTHAREKLATLLWPESDTRHGQGSLRNTLGYLRAALKPAGVPLQIERQTLGYDFEFPFQADVQLVEAATKALHTGTTSTQSLQDAIEAYDGDFLDGFSLGDAPGFDNWASLERESWHRQIVAICDRLCQVYEVGGNFNQAVDTARRWLALDPYNETAYQRLIQYHFAAGDRTAALEAYDELRVMLDEEFDAEPAPEAEALVARIRSEVRPTSNRLKPEVFPERGEMPFVGRAAEHTALVTAYHAAQQGHPQVALLVGEGGIGKTRLATEFLRWAVAQGADVLRGRAFETGGQLPYQAVTRALRTRLEREESPRDLLSDIWLAELSRLLPELRERYTDLPPSTKGEAAPVRLFEAVARLGQALASRRLLVLFLDDLQWVDEASLELLRYGLENWVESRSPILLLLNLRTEALPRLQARLHSLEREEFVTRLSLESLQLEDTHELLASLFGPESQKQQIEALVRWLFDKTNGQPFFITETLTALADQNAVVRPSRDEWWIVDWPAVEAIIHAPSSQIPIIPSRIRSLIVSQLHNLSPAGLNLLFCAAVLSREANLECLCKVAGLDEMEGLNALDELLERRLLLETQELGTRPGSAPYYLYSHDQIREIAYQEAGEARRRILHRRAFEALRTTQAPAELAHHATCAGLFDQAFQQRLAAGAAAMEVFAIGEAVQQYESALEIEQNAGGALKITAADWRNLYTQLGRAYELLNDWEKAQTTYHSMLNFARAGEHAEIECHALNRLASVQVNGFFNREAATDLLQDALAVATASGDELGLAETEWNLAMEALAGDQLGLARGHAERALNLAQKFEQPDLSVRILSTLAYTNLRLRHWHEVIAYSKEAQPHLLRSGDRAMQADFLRQAGLAYLFVGRPAEGINDLGEAYAIGLEIDNLWGKAGGAFQLANGLLETGSYGEAWNLLQQAIPLARSTEHPHLIAMSLTILGKAQRIMMALEEARATLLEVLSVQAEGLAPLFPDWALAELCAVSALFGDWNAASTYARKILDIRLEEALPPVGLTTWYETEALLRSGDEDIARSSVNQLNQLVGDNPRSRISSMRSLAVLAHWDNNLDQEHDHLAEANTLANEIGLPGERWEIQTALGNLYKIRGEKKQAHRSFSQAAEIVEMLAEKIEDDELRKGFLSAPLIRSVFESRKASTQS